MTAAMLEATACAPAPTSRRTSTSFAERIRIGDARPRPDALRRRRRARRRARPRRSTATLTDGDRVTQFELLTAAAFAELAARGRRRRGGRGRARRPLRRHRTCCAARVQVLTNVGLEHTRWLGPTVRDIAREKLAVVRAGRDARARRPTAEARRARRGARDERARESSRAAPTRGVARSPGAFQRATSRVAARPPRRCSGALDDAAVGRAPRPAHRVPGRLQVVGERPLTILDGAHNPSGIAALAEALAPDARPLVAGRLDPRRQGRRRRCSRALLPQLRRASSSPRAPNPRALPPATLASLAAQLGGAADDRSRTRARRSRARASSPGPDGAVLATGSIYLVADLLSRAGAQEGVGCERATAPASSR